jgi:hypothetical protein
MGDETMFDSKLKRMTKKMELTLRASEEGERRQQSIEWKCDEQDQSA